MLFVAVRHYIIITIYLNTGLTDLKCSVNQYLLQEIDAVHCDIPYMVSPQFAEFADEISAYYGFSPGPASTIEEGLELYFTLLQALEYCNLY